MSAWIACTLNNLHKCTIDDNGIRQGTANNTTFASRSRPIQSLQWISRDLKRCLLLQDSKRRSVRAEAGRLEPDSLPSFSRWMSVVGDRLFLSKQARSIRHVVCRLWKRKRIIQRNKNSRMQEQHIHTKRTAVIMNVIFFRLRWGRILDRSMIQNRG